MGTCDKCGQRFEYYLGHSGFGDCAYAYCDKCGATAILNTYSKKVPRGVEVDFGQALDPKLEPLLDRCKCGGSFKSGASPRCPTCHRELSAEAATTFLEANAPGTKKGWRWQRDWTGLYCIIINDNWVEDNWKGTHPS